MPITTRIFQPHDCREVMIDAVAGEVKSGQHHFYGNATPYTWRTDCIGSTRIQGRAAE
jgi:hypothetical protein